MEQNKSFFVKDFLLLEADRFELSLKYAFQNGLVCSEDYEYLKTTLKMIRTFLNSKIQQHKHNVFNDSYLNYDSKPNNYKRNRYVISPGQLSIFEFKTPLPITGEIKVTGLTESLQKLGLKESKKNNPHFPHKIPAGTLWNQIIIKFLDNENVDIIVKKQRHTTNYKEMGFVGKGNIPEPSEQWIFLKVLAKCHGEITIKDESSRDTYKQQKYLLSESLKQYFSIDFDPFYPYKSSQEKNGNSYKIKLILLPPPISSSRQIYREIHEPSGNEDELGIKEFLDEHTPSIVE